MPNMTLPLISGEAKFPQMVSVEVLACRNAVTPETKDAISEAYENAQNTSDLENRIVRLAANLYANRNMHDGDLLSQLAEELQRHMEA